MPSHRHTPERPTAPLEERILAVFEQAYAEGEFEVADHLLTALETLDARDDHKTGADRALAEAYLAIARTAAAR